MTDITDSIGEFDSHDPESIFDPTEVKGPDPDHWGDDADRPSSEVQVAEPLDDNGEPMEVKGPDPAVWGDVDG